MLRCILVLTIVISLLHNSFQIYVVTNSTKGKQTETNPAVWTEGEIWGPLLEEWVLGNGNYRESRVTQLIPIQSAVEINDTSLEMTKMVEKEPKISSTHKIVNNSSGIKKPSRQISETEMYLLGAMEKLVYKMDFMEKRLRRVEEMLYFAMAGNKIDQDPCPEGFNRAGVNCYLFAGTAGRELDWKAANKQCKKFGASLAEMETIEENQDVIRYIISLDYLRGREYWTGGLNPGLLWIWTNSARPVKTSNKPDPIDPTGTITGNGRCLQLSYNPALRSYSYRGSDCATRHSYICELVENSASNQLRRLGRSKKILNEL